jgi:hypothetical protein
MGYGCVGPSGASRNVYKIVTSGLKIVAVDEGVLGCPIHKDVSGGKAPQLLLNADTLAKATILGIGGAIAEETTFFTSIKPGWITIEFEKQEMMRKMVKVEVGFKGCKLFCLEYELKRIN